MRELALHILDLVQNSIEAQATAVLLEVAEETEIDRLMIRVADNGRGMDEAMRRQVADPFMTTRTTRRIGLGLPLIDMSTRQCGGYLKVESTPGRGTRIEAVYRLSHLDRPPLGNMAETIKTIIIGNPALDFRYEHQVDRQRFCFSTRQLLEVLDGIPFTHPDVLIWLDEYLTGNEANLYGGVLDENT